MTDLFDRHAERSGTKREKFREWIMQREWVTTSDVIRWGLDNFYNRADREARALAEDGKLRRLTDEEKIRVLGKNSRQDVWTRNVLTPLSN